MKKLLMTLMIGLIALFYALTISAQENKDITSFDEMKISIKKMEMKILVENQSVFAKDLVLTPDLSHKKMDLAANWGTVSGKTIFLPESNSAVINFLFSLRQGELPELMEFQKEMEELNDLEDAGLFLLTLVTTRVKYITATATFSLNGKTIKRNVNFALDPLIGKDVDYSMFDGEIPLFKAVITDELLGIPTLEFTAENKMPFRALVKNESLGLSFAVKDEKSVKVLAANLPADGVYNFDVFPEIGGYTIPKLTLKFIVGDGKIMLSSNPFGAELRGDAPKRRSMVTLQNNRSEAITVYLPPTVIGNNSFFAGKKQDSKADVSGSRGATSWKAVSIAPGKKTKIFLDKTAIRGLLTSGSESEAEILILRVANKGSQTIGIGW